MRESESKGWGLERIGCREKLILLGFDLGREVRLRDREREFGPKKPPSEVVVSGGCDEPWQQREEEADWSGRFSLLFFLFFY